MDGGPAGRLAGLPISRRVKATGRPPGYLKAYNAYGGAKQGLVVSGRREAPPRRGGATIGGGLLPVGMRQEKDHSQRPRTRRYDKWAINIEGRKSEGAKHFPTLAGRKTKGAAAPSVIGNPHCCIPQRRWDSIMIRLV